MARDGFILRPYQESAIAQIKDYFKQGIKKVLLHLATGAGKTVIFCKILKSTEANGKKALMVVKGIDLVHNASQRLTREGVVHGVIQGSTRRIAPRAPIQVCSIDTLYRRNMLPEADLVVIDEAHLTMGKSYAWLLNNYPTSYILGVTATPHVKAGLRHVADACVYPITIGSLIEQKYLVPPKYFVVPNDMDFSRIRTKKGEYVDDDVVGEMDRVDIYCDLVDTYKRQGQRRPAILFAVNIEHSKLIADKFNYAGIPAEQVDQSTPAEERRAVLKRLESGETKVVTNVNVLCLGVDMPYVSLVILARPTRSYNMYVQQLGRGTRPYLDKEDFYVFDHVRNIENHGFIEHERKCKLDGWMGAEPKPINCKKCFAVFCPKEQYEALKAEGLDPKTAYKARWICPKCLYDNSPEVASLPGKPGDYEYDEEGVLKPLDEKDVQWIAAVMRLKELKQVRKEKGYRRGWMYHVLKAEFGEETASRLLPKRNIPPWVPRKNTKSWSALY